MNGLFDKVSAYVNQYHMLAAGDAVAAGVSGGADSVCLLFVLSELRKKIPFRLMVVHVNHKIRPEAGEDAAYVHALCNKLGIPFYLYEEDVTAYAREKGISAEEAGRMIRYEAFRTVLRKEAPQEYAGGKVKIATAHHMDDRAETMLFHLFRGCGINGLCGIRPVREDKDDVTVIHPLLGIRRREIETFLKQENIPWCEDSTNAEDVYVRNRIRHKILPCAEQEIAPGAVGNMCRTADLLTEVQDYIKGETKKAYENCVTEENAFSFSIDRKIFSDYHILIQKNILYYIVEKLSNGGKDITSAHIKSLLSLFEKEGNRCVCLPYGIRGEKKYEKIFITGFAGEKGKAQSVLSKWEIPVVLPGIGEPEKIFLLPDGTEAVFQVLFYEKTINIPQNQYTKWFDYDKIEKPLMIRTRKEGDYLTIDQKQRRKSLQDYMVNEKILKEARDRIPLLCEGSHVLWITGYRISSFYKIDENTKYILQVQLRGGQVNVRTCQCFNF